MGLPKKEENEKFFPLLDPVTETARQISLILWLLIPFVAVAIGCNQSEELRPWRFACAALATLVLNLKRLRIFIKSQKFRAKAGLRELILTKNGLYVLSECVSLDIDATHKSFLEGADSPWYFFSWQDIEEWSFVTDKRRHFYRVRIRNQEDIRILRRPELDQPVVQALKAHAPRVIVQSN